MQAQIKNLLEASKKVLRKSSFKNGAIIASPSSNQNTEDYNFVWPRDAAYSCIAANILDLKIQEKFFNWCTKAEGWNETGLFYEKYFTNGKKTRNNFQPDQTGTVLLAVKDYCKQRSRSPSLFKKLIKHSADGLCNIWGKDHFDVVTQDLWEERFCFPDLKENFTYSLAASCAGLISANEMIPNKKWIKSASEMENILLNNSEDYFFRSSGKLDDKRVDASLIGLVWPFGLIPPNDKKILKTVKLIEQTIAKNFRVYRYENDEYDGWMYKDDICRKKGAGYWTLLNFWMSIYLSKKHDKLRALRYYKRVLDDLKEEKFIPEQIFKNNIQASVKPLCWSHSMFIIASKELGYLS